MELVEENDLALESEKGLQEIAKLFEQMEEDPNGMYSVAGLLRQFKVKAESMHHMRPDLIALLNAGPTKSTTAITVETYKQLAKEVNEFIESLTLDITKMPFEMDGRAMYMLRKGAVEIYADRWQALINGQKSTESQMRIKLELCCYQFFDLHRDLKEGRLKKLQAQVRQNLLTIFDQIHSERIMQTKRMGFFSHLHFRVEEKSSNTQVRDMWMAMEFGKVGEDKEKMKRVVEKRVGVCRQEEKSLKRVSSALEQLMATMRTLMELVKQVVGEGGHKFEKFAAYCKIIRQQFGILEELHKEYKTEMENVKAEIESHEKMMPYMVTSLP